MLTQSNICTSIVYLLFMTKMIESVYLFRMPVMVGRKCCRRNNEKQINVNQKPSVNSETDFRRDMPELYMGNMQGTAPLPETEAPVIKHAGSSDVPQVEKAEEHSMSPEEQKALLCAKLPCQKEDHDGLVCACNFNLGRVVSFKNECDLRRHNCRFNTDFRVILNDVCPWQYESRHGAIFDYSNPSYYN